MVENVLWPAYFDAELSRAGGRRVPADLAVPRPTVDELAEAVRQVGYDAVVERDVSYPREYEPRGRVLVKDADDATKSDLVGAVGAYLGAIRERDASARSSAAPRGWRWCAAPTRRSRRSARPSSTRG